MYFFCQITAFINVRVAFVFGLQILWLKDFRKIYQLKGLKPKNKGHTNFYECCDLTEKVYLVYLLCYRYISFQPMGIWSILRKPVLVEKTYLRNVVHVVATSWNGQSYYSWAGKSSTYLIFYQKKTFF